MKGHYETRANGQRVDVPPCRTCKHKNKMTVEAPCYNCIDPVALALHKPNAETDFIYYEPEGEEGKRNGGQRPAAPARGL